MKIQKFKLRQTFKQEVKYFNQMIKSIDYTIFHLPQADIYSEYRLFPNQEDESEAIYKYLILLDLEDINRFDLSHKSQFSASGNFAINSLLMSLKMGNNFPLHKAKSYTFIDDFSEIYRESNLYKIKYKRDGQFLENIDKYGALGNFFILDFNRTLSLDEARSILNELNLSYIKYIEEPCHTFADSLSLKLKHPFKVAIDESLYLQELTPEIDYIIIKPAIFSDFTRNESIITWAKECGIPVIVGSSYNTSYGLLFLQKYALYYGLCDELMGLDTAKLTEKEEVL